MFLRLLTFGLLAIVGIVHAEQWAVLAAGSYKFHNYRHQAGICRAHKVLRDRGVNENNIITMMFDDIANDPQNPIPGKLFNEPAKTLEAAVDVYEGCKPDYRLFNVTPENFLAVLLGDAKKAGGKVLKSGSEDTVFVNFVDHGAAGLVAFPHAELHAKRLLETLMTMAEQRRFRQLLFYMEACESGSMFQDLLPSNLSISAVTSASADEPSHGLFCGVEARIGHDVLYSCLGDEFGVGWMRDSERQLPRETVAEQFDHAKNATEMSHVQRFGKSFKEQLLADFQGPGKRSVRASLPASASRVSSRDVKLEMLRAESARTGDDRALVAELEDRRAVEMLRRDIVVEALGSDEEFDGGAFTWTWELLQCHERVAGLFGRACGWSENRLLLSKTLLQLCRKQPGRVFGAVSRACGAVQTLLV